MLIFRYGKINGECFFFLFLATARSSNSKISIKFIIFSYPRIRQGLLPAIFYSKVHCIQIFYYIQKIIWSYKLVVRYKIYQDYWNYPPQWAARCMINLPFFKTLYLLFSFWIYIHSPLISNHYISHRAYNYKIPFLGRKRLIIGVCVHMSLKFELISIYLNMILHTFLQLIMDNSWTLSHT